MATRTLAPASGDYGMFWPGYVDVLSTLLLVVTFLMSVFMMAQYFASQEASGKDTALKQLDAADRRAHQPSQPREGQGQVAPRTSWLLCRPRWRRCGSENERLSGFAVPGDDKARRRPASPRSPATSRAEGRSPTRRWPRSICSTSSCWRCAGRSRPSTRRWKPPRRRTRTARRASRIWAPASTRRSPARCRSCSATAPTSSAACASC